ncbi:MAG: biopolymer transporter ExbD [Proteobacteria bacterium]|nr:MAG: biopolymer transporter ExbD [Pseudomonadota bacterium]
MQIDWNESPELNITPLVDIMLVLLAILMVTTPALVYEENIALPSGSKSKSISKIPDLEIAIDKKRIVKIKESSYPISSFADNFILSSVKYDKNTHIYIRADKTLQYQDVMYVLKSVKNAGFSKVALETGE